MLAGASAVCACAAKATPAMSNAAGPLGEAMKTPVPKVDRRF